MDWYPLLIIAHIVGVALGVGGATLAEINLIRALRNGRISPEEDALMRGTYAILRLGFFILIVSGFGFLVYYRLTGSEELLYSPKLWAKLSIIGFLVVNAALIALHAIPIKWGSAISITSWYAALILGSLRSVDASIFTLLAIYAASVVAVYAVLHVIHRRFVANPSP